MKAARAGRFDEQLGHVAQTDRLDAADVEHLAIGRVVGAGDQKGIDRIVDVGEVAQLRSIAKDRDVLAVHGLTNEPERRLAIVSDQHAWAVGIGQAQDAGLDAVHVVVEHVVALAG